MEIKSVTIIGQGNVATHYCRVMNTKGLDAKTVSSRLPFKTEDLQCDLLVIAVKDEAIQTVADKLSESLKSTKTLHPLTVHTSGFISCNCLKKVSENYGSLYPLQTLKKDIETNFDSVPLCTWANNKESALILRNLAKKLSKIHYELDDNQRKTLHLAAVFANNFPNHLFGIAKRILDRENVPFDILFPLMDRTVAAAKQNNPFSIQTGPAFRDEKSVMEQHKLRLTERERCIYEIISNSIMQERNLANNTLVYTEENNNNKTTK
ncbi:MAG: DUF2520 domain-containing protein [Bacteroidales bacterium]|nr:DUF2520 domain-containing protein [Bacteroidales bacterium]